MNRTIKEATVKRFFYDTHERFKAHLSSFIAACNSRPFAVSLTRSAALSNVLRLGDWRSANAACRQNVGTYAAWWKELRVQFMAPPNRSSV